MSLQDFNEAQLRELDLWPLASWPATLSGAQPAVAATPSASAGGQGAAASSNAAARAPSREPASAASGNVPMPRPAMQRAPSATPPATGRPAMGAAAPASSAAARPARAPQPGLGEADWSDLRERVSRCDACSLCKQRKQAVFGTGIETGPWLFVGEGPGAEEDDQGEPFVGQAGKLLDAMLSSIQLSRQKNVYIANVVKCRPPGNRTPTLDEAAACADYLDRQIELVSPTLIVALGKTAALRLTGQDATLASLRGKVHRYRDYPVLVTYHPAYLLRNLPDKAKAWEDLLRARQLFAEQS